MDGGADLHFAEMTVTLDEKSRSHPWRTIDVLRFVQPETGHTMVRTVVDGCRSNPFRIWTSCDQS
jgi:hypothetical protein